mgnify:CR=1 FL=1
MQVEIYWRELLWLLFGCFPVLFIHELGHALAGWALGNRGATIRYGDPSSRWKTVLPLGPLRIELNWGLGLWLWYPLCRFDYWPLRSPGRRLLFILGGPMASALLLLLLWPDHVGDVVLYPRLGLTTAQWLQYWGLWPMVLSLVPVRYRGGFPSDGLQIIMHTRDLLRPQRKAAP